MHNVIDISCGYTYLCEVFEYAYNNYYISYGEKPSMLILSPNLYKELQFEYAGNEPVDFMGLNIFIKEDIEDDLVLIL